MAYLVRRLLENTSNESFLKASSVVHLPADDLLQDPEEVGAMWRRKHPVAEPAAAAVGVLPPFRNEPPADFSQDENRKRLRAALDDVRGRLGRFYPRHLAANEVAHPAHEIEPADPARHLISYDPGDTATVIGFTPRCSADDARAAVGLAREAFPGWSATPARQRADVLLRAADQMRRRRFELAAWEIVECGKPWREADADVAEAIDYCEFYAREMIRRAAPDHRDVPGETNAIESIARGVAVVIAPWNFPLAIPTGMTTAALVAGNTVLLKPSEQSPIIAWHLARILHDAGLPPNALQFLPGTGEEVGQALVQSPDVDLIAFTGSRDVGLLINHQAARPQAGQDHVKRVIAEMGGKNAILIDDDADLDEAVVGVLQSAFGYAGQKCSACARVIVLEGIHDAFLTRLVEAAKALPVGPADDPDTVVGPLIDADALRRVRDYARLAEREGRIVLAVDVGPLADRGYYFGPMIVADVPPESRIAREEIFGPILAVERAHDLEEALQLAQQTDYALTGGLYSRSPAHIERVRREFRVGNLYINRPITGAWVDRQPFGGFKLSGIGTKAGGREYLNEFLLTRVVTENTMRRGFAPDGDGPLQEVLAGRSALPR